jgi:hypothetical protein
MLDISQLTKVGDFLILKKIRRQLDPDFDRLRGGGEEGEKEEKKKRKKKQRNCQQTMVPHRKKKKKKDEEDKSGNKTTDEETRPPTNRRLELRATFHSCTFFSLCKLYESYLEECWWWTIGWLPWQWTWQWKYDRDARPRWYQHWYAHVEHTSTRISMMIEVSAHQWPR